ncbi:sensor domain-containing diguanylate cyclase [Psychromonas aquimarina]|uniref:sensor domain-containing diguanylate cyclase n=1 Tax=Psychromonas aquimarina TaxID=444919 RepID=UPI0004089300|nr:sensor domain-containing diguanylate cyclase [Psychromonas aquimarina]
MVNEEQFTEFSKLLQELSSIGFIILDRRMNVIFWNRFMELHSHIKSEEILSRKLTSFFPDVNEAWLNKKIRSTLVLNNQAVTSWEHRPYLLKLPSTQYSIDDVDFMYQNCSYFPVKDSDNSTIAVGIAIYDVTEIAVSQKLLENVTEQALDLQEISTHDHLTGLFNRKFFLDQLVQDASRCRRLNWGLGIAMIDADHFKSINDTYGHQTGDDVLKELAERLQATLRTFDSLCRYGGEEFALILPNTTEQQTRQVCERLRECVDKAPIISAGREIPVTVSIGISFLSRNKSLEEIISEADAALYLAKHNGRNRVEQHQAE